MDRAKVATPWTVHLLSILSLGFGLQQTFRVTPQSVEVVAGSDVTLRCEVDNQRGSAQWTKDGFALGFNRSIPGFHRYVVLGEESSGVHDLRITNVTLQDDGDYQCQVTPFRDAKAIRHAATLTVLLPPAGIEMLGQVVDAPVTVTAGEPLKLECLIKDSKPVSQVVWYRAAEPLRLKSQVDSREKSTSGQHLSTLRTKITFTPTHSDNGVEYSCHALHPALLPQHTPLVGRVRLDVHYEPGAPRVTGYRTGEVLRTGERRTLTCRSFGGNPRPEVAWYRDGQLVDEEFEERDDNISVNAYDLRVRASDNLATYECRVTNGVTSEAKTAEVQPRVHFAPSAVTVSGPSEAKVGEVISLTCMAERSNPAAEVNLVMNGQTPRGARSRTEALRAGSGWTTITSLHAYKVQPGPRRLVVNCHAHNPALGSTKVQTKVISILRPPEPPVIQGYEAARLLTQGEPHSLRCVSGGGNPLARLQWYKGSTLLPTHSTRGTNSTSAELDLRPVASDNGAEYRCEARNSATVEPLSASVVLSVLFPPAVLRAWAEPRVARAGSQVTLVCESGSSNPQAKLTWWRAGKLLQPGDLQVTPGQFGGTTTRYSVQVGVSRKDDGAVFTCHAHNHLGIDIRENLTLSVHYPPVWLQEPSAFVDVTEGEDLFLEVEARANPPDVSFLWLKQPEENEKKKEKEEEEGRVVMRGPLLNLTEVSRGQAGLYTLLASNTEGNTSKNVTVKVKYSASITSITGVQTVDLGGRATLRCVARARPRPHLTWRRPGYDFTRSHITQLPNQEGLQLTILNATMADMGVFTCVAKNEVGEATYANATLLISHRPIIDKSVGQRRTSAEIGDTGRLACRASGAPSVRFRWYTHRHALIQPPAHTQQHQRYILQETKVVDALATHESVLLVRNVSAEDFGDFECRAENGLGSSRVFLRLVAPTRPESPRHLQVMNATHDSVQLAWIPAYDGGLQQKFRIRFRDGTASRYHYRDVHPANDTTFTLRGLAPTTTYHFEVVAYNSRGQSSYSQEAVLATTSRPATESRPPPAKTHVSGLIVVLTTLVSVALLVLNVTLITCFIKRRARKRLPASLDKGVSRGLLPPTVGGPPHTPMTEKAGCEESEGRQEECQASCVRVATTCLVHPLDPPPQYAHSPPQSALFPPQYTHSPPKAALLLPPSHNDLTKEVCDSGQHIQCNTPMELETRYKDQAWQNSTPLEQYEITSLDPVYPLPVHHPPTHSLPTSHTQSNGPLRRNTPFRLHIPKDYIRSGYRNLSVSSSVCGSGAVNSNMPHSHVHALPLTSTPLLSALALGVRQPSVEVPLEQRGHLV